MIIRIHSSNLLLKFVLFSIISLASLSNLKSQCSGTVFDNGGSASNYTNNANVTTTYTATAGNVMRLTFTAFNTQASFDILRIYDGPNTSSPLLATLSGNLTSALPGPFQSTGTTITINFTSNASTTAAGYAITLSCQTPCSNTTAGGTIAANETVCGSFNPANMTSSAAASGGSGTITYQWESSLNNSTWADISGATAATYDPPSVITQTTFYRRKSRAGSCLSWGATSNTITKTVNTAATTANAGLDQTKCYNGSFQMIGNAPGGAETATWSIISGTPLTAQSTNNDSIIYTLPAGQTATLRYTISTGLCSSTDDVVISNTTACTTTCTNPLNQNGDLENEGNATTFPLSFQSTPAALLNSSNYIPGWADRYDNASTPNTTSFTGAYYIKKTGTSGDPNSGTHMIYLSGTPFCLSAMAAEAPIACGKTYRFSAWVAAYTNSATQTPTNFAIEFFGGGTAGTPPDLFNRIQLRAPASASWNDLNWQRYEFTITIPANNYQWADFYFTPQDNSSGLVIDDVCITEVNAGSFANAGADILGCSNVLSLGATPAASGYTGSWSVISNGGLQLASTSSPTTTVTIASGTVGTLRWTVTNGTCTSTDDVVVGYNSGSAISVDDQTICSGWSASLTANNCTGNVLWSNGATTPSITVNPTSTTTYSVTCTPTLGSNLVLNGNFESATNFQSWTNWAGSGITTTAGEFRSGSKGARIVASTTWGGFGQDIVALPGQMYTVSFWAKTSNTNAFGHVGFKFMDASWVDVSQYTKAVVNSTGWQKYTLTALAPLNTAYIQVYADAGEVAIMYVDDIEVYRTTSCTSTDNATVTVITNDNITLGTPVVSAAIDHPLLDVATVSVQVSWTSPPSNDQIKVTYNNKSEYINVGGGATSPQTVTFMVEADGDNNKVISASWLNNPTFACTKFANFATPSPINNQKISCDVLFLCGLDKPYDGDPWDHGMINYLIQNNTGTVSTALTKTDASGYGLYDWNNQSTLLTVNLDDYDLIIVSATTEGHLATGLHRALAGWKGNVLNMNYDMMQELGYSPNNYVAWQTNGFTSPSTQIELLNYDNINPTNSYVLTQGDYYPQASAMLWSSASSATNGLGGVFFKYSAHSNPNISSTHGTRVFLGYHMNGIYANAQNGGALPAPLSSYFSPIKHLTLAGKVILDNALLAAATCSVEICDNDLDDDSDGLVDCYDPDCGQITNREFDGGTTGWSLYQQNGGAATFTVDATTQISGLNSARINTTVATGTDWHVQFAQTGKSIVAGKTYKFSFKAKAASNRTISSAVDLGISPWTSYTWNNSALTTSVQTFTYYFTPTVTVNNNIRTIFNLGTTAGIVYLDDIRLEEVCTVYSCASGTCETSNLVNNGFFSLNTNNWTTTNGQLSLGTGGLYGNFAVLNNSDLTGHYYMYQDVAFDANASYKFTGHFAKHGTGNNSKVYLEFYNGNNFISRTPDVFTTYNYDGNFQAIPNIEGVTPPNTTKIRIVGYANGTALKIDNFSLVGCDSCPEICTNGIDDDGDSNVDCSDADCVSTLTPLIKLDATGLTNGNLTTWSNKGSLGGSFGNNGTTPVVGTVGGRQAVTFDGTDVMISTFNAPSGITGSGSFTVGGWFFNPTVQDEEALLSWSYRSGPDGTNAHLNYGSNASFGAASHWGAPDMNYLTTPTAGTWHYIVLTHSGGTNGIEKIYVDGQLVNEESKTLSIYANQPFHLGAARSASTGGSTLHFTGSIASVVVFDDVLSASEIYTLSKNATFVGCELCYNGLDDDGDGLTDAQDSNCNTCTTLGQNLVVNGEFDSGNSGFTSNYTFTPIGSMCGNFGIYSVSNRVSKVGAPNGCNNSIWSVADRANTGGNFMFIDPSSYTGVNDRIWEQSITVCPNTDYVFSIWTKNMYYLEASGYSGIDPNFQFRINGSILPGADFTMPRQPMADSLVWIKVQGVWNSGSATSATLSVMNKVPGSAGNDLAIDGIYFGLCGKEVSITAGATSFCSGSSTTLTASTATTSSNWAFYEWLRDGVVVSSGANLTSLNVTQSGVYRLKVYTTANNTGCANESNAITVTVTATPTITATTPASRCGTGTVTLQATASGGTINWYTTLTGGTSIATGNSYTTPSLTTTTTYYVDATFNGCTTSARTPIVATINTVPTVSMPGTTLCAGATMTLSPTTGGSWASSNTAVATITLGGVVTGVAAGTATFTYTNATTGCVSNPTSTLTVNAKPTVSITGASAICVGATTTLSPSTGGTWTSSNTAVATVTNAGVVTGIAAGTANFTFTNTTTGCISNATSNVTVVARPTVSITGASAICIGATTTLSPSTGGTWASSNTGIATVTNTGIVTGIAAGTATFTFTNTSTGCISNPTSAVTINAKPAVSITGPATICVGATTTLSPSTGGTWASSNIAIATVDNAGLVTGVAAGTATFTFTNSTTGCVSNATSAITINAKPTVSITGATAICEAATTTLSPTTGGTWVSNNPTIASVTNAGVVTGLLPGTATFSFTNSTTGCVSNPTAAITVNAKPVVSIIGSSSICVGEMTNLAPTTGGTWASSNTAIAIVDNSGVVTGVSAGTATFTFTNSTTGCVSNASGAVTVNAKPTVSITGASAICETATTTLSPTTGGTWVSSNTAIATVTNAGVVTGVAPGSVTFTFTNSTTGCASNPTAVVTINGKPVATITGSNIICVGGTTTLSPTTGGTWASSNSGVASVTNAGVVTAIAAGTANFTFTNSTTGCVSNASAGVTVTALSSVSITGPSTICVGQTTTLSPSTGGTWASSNNAVATVTNAGVVTGISAGTANFTYTNSSTNCVSNATSNITVNAKPSVGIIGASTICVGGTTTLSPSSGGTWTSSNNAIATVTNAGVVTGVAQGSVTFTFTNSTTGCTSNATSPITVGAGITASIDYMGSVCLKDNTQIAVNHNNGTAPFTYVWTGPASFTGNTKTISIVNNGNYYVTVTDAVGCSASTSGFVYQKYEPFIVSLSSEVCEGQPVNLSVSSASAVAYQWGSNAGNATTANVTVYPSYPSSTYAVTVTNDLGCTAVPTATINAKQKPVISITGSANICVGSTTTLSPTTGGTWVSSNTSVATVTNAGVVTAVGAGTATFTFTNTTSGCVSNPSAPVTVYSKPSVLITGPAAICLGSSTTLWPTSGGTWTSSNPAVASVTNGGIVTGLSKGTATFTFTNTTTGCVSNPTSVVTVDDQEGVTITGPSAVCIGSVIDLEASKTNGTWSSSDNSIATVNASGLVTPVASGTVIITYASASGACQNESTHAITVNAKPTATLTGPATICAGNTTTLTPSSGGTWASSNPAVATISNTGLVTGLTSGTATFTFTNTTTGCVSNASSAVTVNAKPTVAITGPATICAGSTTTLSPTTGGTWVSSNNTVATVTNSGLVTAVSNGSVTFTFTQTSTGCVSNPTSTVVIGASFTSTIDYNGSVCLTDTSKLKALTSGGVGPFTYNWAGPSGFTGNAQIVSITSNGSYYLTVTDALGCSDNKSGYVYERYEPFILNSNTSICEGINVTLNVSANNVASYLWSANAGSATGSSVTVTPVVPSSAYQVTVTNTNGCTAVANTSITVNQKPIVSILGNQNICVNNTTTLAPNSGGSWASSNNSVATVTNDGIVTGIATGTATFTFTNGASGCSSNPTSPISVGANVVVSAVGPTDICIGDTTYLLPSSGGSWSSSNNSVATINAAGRVIAVAAGVANFTFTSSSGCSSGSSSIPVVVNNKPMTALIGDNEICISGTTSFVPSSGGIWTSSNDNVATISNDGIVTGTGVGTVRFIFEDGDTGCKSDSTTAISVVNGTNVTITGPTQICIGATTTLSPSTGGTWSSSNPAIASVTNAGVVTGVNSGVVHFIYHNLATGCSSVTGDIEVLPRPVVSISGPASICIGSTTTLSPATGGTWVSNNPAVASVTNSGVVTGLALGNASFVFTNSTTGCISNNSPVVTVYTKPVVSITGPTDICIGGTSTVAPTTGGTWTSSNPAIATITNAGVVTGISLGSAQFTYFETNSSCVSDPTAPINIINKPTVAITGPNAICIGSTTTLSPSTGGAWVSSNNAVATVSSSGVVTGISQGTVTFTFIANGGCTSDPTAPVTINGKPSISVTGPLSICVGATSQVSPTSGGTWVSLNPAIASVNNSGVVTGLTQGGARFRFTSTSNGCVSDPSNEIIVNAAPAVSLIGSPAICIGSTSQVSPTTGGIWTSSAPAIASVNNSGHITGISAGTANMTFTSTTTGCSSLNPIAITVNPKPLVSITGPAEICVGSTTTLNPSTGGTWASNNPSVATVTNSGIVTAVSQGNAKFIFTDNNTGCQSNFTNSVIVNPRPTILFTGPTEICIGSSTTISPVSGGSWTSSNTNIATITNGGVITGVAEGVVNLTFTDGVTGCTSLPSGDLTVNDAVNVSITGPSEICMGYTTTLFPTTGGFWTAINPNIANITAAGIVTGKAPGKTGFYFTQSVTGCVSYLDNDAITVEHCVNPDFNVGMINETISGDAATNDNIALPVTYSNNTILVQKPVGSLTTLNINADGSYSFSANEVGQYKYLVPVCISPLNYGCPTSQLVITVVNPFEETVDIVANTDLTQVYKSTASAVKQTTVVNMYNDDCISNSNCDLVSSNVSMNVPPTKGAYTMNTNNMVYTPQDNYIGCDTMQTMVCEDNTNSNCAYSEQFVVVRHESAKNTVVASDDFFNGHSGSNISGNVKMNDSDPENNNISINAQGSLASPVTITQGSYYLLSDGSFHFTPAPGFTGSFDIVYTVCDDNALQACKNATIHILVFGDMTLKIRVYLEGALMSNGNQVSSTGKPLMRDNLRNNPFDGKNYIPLKDPYQFGTTFVDVTARYQHVGSGGLSQFEQISDSTAVFSVDGENAIVDWVFVELRSKVDSSLVMATRSGLLQRDGDIVDLDGQSDLLFPGIIADSFYVAVRHRSHLGVMSQKVTKDNLIDFTSPNLPVFDFGTSLYSNFSYEGLALNTNVKFGYRALWAGDSNSDGKIKFTNPGDDQNLIFYDVFIDEGNATSNANYDFTIGYYQGDFNMNGKAKYDNPNDDKNLLFGQILLYPLNTNYLSNFNFFIEQIP